MAFVSFHFYIQRYYFGICHPFPFQDYFLVAAVIKSVNSIKLIYNLLSHKVFVVGVQKC